MDRRVAFDFEIEFTNGGSLQGRDFRLDIPGEDAPDGWIADTLVRDLRLLMVGDVRIRNKRILQEPHKRGFEPDTLTRSSGERRLVDLSHQIEAGMTTYPGLPEPRIDSFLTRAASTERYAAGVTFAIDVVTLCGNTGTYVDSPFHRYAEGQDLAGLPLPRLVNVPAVRVDVTGAASRAVDKAALLPYDLAGRAVLIRTGHDRHWRTEAYERDNPYLTEDAAELLVAEGAAVVGIDSLNIDDPSDRARPVHSGLLGAGIPICEHLTNLGEVPIEGAWFSAIPAPVRGTGTFPVRAVASIPI